MEPILGIEDAGVGRACFHLAVNAPLDFALNDALATSVASMFEAFVRLLRAAVPFPNEPVTPKMQVGSTSGMLQWSGEKQQYFPARAFSA